jgi:hypothetical protein
MISIKRKHFHLIINFCLIATLFSDGYTQNVYLKEIRKPVQNGGEDIIKTSFKYNSLHSYGKLL